LYGILYYQYFVIPTDKINTNWWFKYIGTTIE